MDIKHATHIGFLNKENNLVIWNEITKNEQTPEKSTLKLNLSDPTILNKKLEPLEMCFFLYSEAEKTQISYAYIYKFNLKELYINTGHHKLSLDIIASFSKQFAYNEKGTLLTHDFKFVPEIIEQHDENKNNTIFVNYKDKYYNLNGETFKLTSENKNKDKFHLYYDKYSENGSLGYIYLCTNTESIVFKPV